MSIEVTCGECQGRLLVEQENVIVQCPHCGVALQLGTPSSSVLSESTISSNLATDSKSPTEVRSSSEVVAEENANIPTASPAEASDLESSFLAPPIVVDAPLPEHDDPVALALPVAEADSSDSTNSLSKLSSVNQPQISAPEDAAGSEAESDASVAAGDDATTSPELAVSSTRKALNNGDSSKMRGLLIAYASAVTLALIYYLLTSHTSQLESLPDIEPPLTSEQKVIFNIVPEDASLPAGHTLQLGESQRFGDVVVTPLRVTRGPLEFTHYDPEQKNIKPKPPTKDVLKLWLKFENVSSELPVKPLGRLLTFKRGLTKKGEVHLRANQFVCQLAEKKRDGQLIFLYDLPVDDIWDLKQQDIERSLKPGETFETYLPTQEENITTLTGVLVWRTHIRKGHHPESLRGVTTLFEVRLHSDEIVDEI